MCEQGVLGGGRRKEKNGCLVLCGDRITAPKLWQKEEGKVDEG